MWAGLGRSNACSGWSYRYLKRSTAQRLGRLISFLFIWQFSFSAPLSIASGAIGLADYAGISGPGWGPIHGSQLESRRCRWSETLKCRLVLGGTFLAVASLRCPALLLYRRITAAAGSPRLCGRRSVGTGRLDHRRRAYHVKPARAFDFPAGAFTFSRNFFLGLGSAMLIATYDYWGYYNVCFWATR